MIYRIFQLARQRQICLKTALFLILKRMKVTNDAMIQKVKKNCQDLQFIREQKVARLNNAG